jgi:1-acyl-sn-glycerol-3-phosphate acyltransferase
MRKKLARFLIDLIIWLTARIEVHGLEHIQNLESGIVAGNHIGRLDALLIYHFMRREDIIMLVAEKYQKVALARWFVRQLDAIFVDRFNADFTVLREVLKRLKQGGLMVMSPEGTRSPNAELQEAWPGGSFLAQKSGVPVIPVGLAGSEDACFFSNLRRLKRTRVVARVGEPFYVVSTPGSDRQAELKRNTDEIMCRIAAQLPPAYRGVYADHPRLIELLEKPSTDGKRAVWY